MVSSPSYDPNDIESNWKLLSKQADGALLNRAVQGLYPPGSTIKPMIADAALTNAATNEREILTVTVRWMSAVDKQSVKVMERYMDASICARR